MSTTKESKAAKRLREKVTLHSDHISGTSSSAFPGIHPGYDDAWNIESFKKGFKIEIIEEPDPYTLVFDMIGVDAAIANTFRRILIAELPTMAIESCYFRNNTSIMPDEILAHRLGLIPLNADPRRFSFRGNEDPTDEDTIVFKLHVKCERNMDADPDACNPEEMYKNSSVTSGQLEWIPQGNQEEGDPIAPVHNDILLMKLRPGQEIDVELHCVKGVGKEHAKWSPVATASYRLMPCIEFEKEVKGALADRMAAAFNKGVVEVVKNESGERVAKVVNPRLCSMSRNVLRDPELAPLVRLDRIRDHFIFSIESTGALTARELLVEAVKTLQEKCAEILGKLDELENPEENEEEEEDSAEE